MSAVPLHPALVHLPLGIAFVLPLVSLAVTLALWRQWVTPKTWAIVVLLQAVLVGSGVLALRTGEVEEEWVEAVVAERYIEAHEDAAKSFMLAAGASLAVGAAGLLSLGRRRALLGLAGAVTLASFVVAGLGVLAGKPGGELVYVHGAADAYAPSGQAMKAAAPKHHPDD